MYSFKTLSAIMASALHAGSASVALQRMKKAQAGQVTRQDQLKDWRLQRRAARKAGKL